MNSYTLVVQNSVGLHWKPFLRSKNLPFNPIHASSSRKNIHSNCSSCAVRLGGFGNNLSTNNKINKRYVAYSNVDGGDPSSSGASSGNWKGWVIGIVISFILPFFTHKLGPLEIWKKKFDAGLQQIENEVEDGVKIAEGVEKEAEKWLDRLPAGWLKGLLTCIEQGAEKTVKFLSNVDIAIDKEEEGKIEERLKSCEEKSKDSEENEKK